MIRSWTCDGGAALFLYEENDAADLPQGWQSLIAPAERARAAKMGSPARARTFLRARALLRKKLGDMLAMPPADVGIELTPEGKPVLAGHSLAFSLSHSRGLILVGILEAGGALGVDLEHMDPATDIGKIARRLFTDEERAKIGAAPAAARR